MDEMLALAAAFAQSYFQERDARPVFPGAEATAALAAFDEPLPDHPTEGSAVLSLLHHTGSPGTTATTGGRYFGFVTGAAHPVGVAAAWMAAAWDQPAALEVMSPTAAAIDRVAGSWLVELFGLPATAQATFTAGTSSANLSCLAVARDALLADAGWDGVNQGLFGAPELRVVVSEAAHSSITKALGVAGLGRERVVAVPADDQGRMRADQLPEAGPPTLVIGQAGNVNSGAFDPFDAIADHFSGTPSWLHVDGAFGLWAAASPDRAHLLAGVERADSWAVDMHKWLNVTYDSAVAIVRNRADMARSFHVGAAYLPDSETLDPLHRGIDMSQRARAIETWAVLKSLGRSGVADLVDRTCRLARRFADELADVGFTVCNEVVINQVLVRLDTEARTQTLIDSLAADGTLWAGSSRWRDRAVLRISVSSWATTDADVDSSVAALTRLAAATQQP